MIRLDDIIERVSTYNPTGDLDIIKKAYIFSAKVHKGQLRLSGEPYLNHPIEVAMLLAELKLDPQTIATGLLHDTVEDTFATIEEIREFFGPEVADMVDGVTKIGKIAFATSEEKQAENFRKMVLAMGKDIRVILVKLADRLHNMRTLEHLSREKQLSISQETHDIYAPIANRLGIGWVKSELEDLSLRYLKPDLFNKISRMVSEKWAEREKFITDFKSVIQTEMEKNGIQGEVTGRPKHIYGISKKVSGEHIDLDQLNDIMAFRIKVDSVKDCYGSLGMIHSLWKPVPGRFKDFIAISKANGYQSLHTTVIAPNGERVEVQIRTREMHRVAEDGIAAHWKYKEDKAFSQKDDKRFSWLRQLLEWQRDLKDPGEFMETVKVDLFSEEVYVFTPKGEVKELPRGATPLDFAYNIHSDIGHRCVGAKVNGRIVPLKYQLRNGDTLEILTSPTHHPSKDSLKFVVTPKAKARIRQWINTEERERSISLGREMIEKELKKYSFELRNEDIGKVVADLSIPSAEDLYARVGYGKLPVHNVLSRIVPKDRLAEFQQKPKLGLASVISRFRKKPESAIKIQGLEDVLVRFANCCNPLPGDKVIGFITRGRGVTVHRVECLLAKDIDPERKVDVQWDSKAAGSRPAKIEVVCVDKKGLLADMSSTITSAEANITSAQIRTTEDKKAISVFELEVGSVEQLQRVMASLSRVKGVLKVERLRA
ncbi:MAG: bifunctional (p)ppGpp synthetase/guanosine-3',5'-bis(diphosphate) 3'-pyrophosphohydrolase [Deltaproteobacteria bacterium]|nr:bifunctional (p)ppGpp synthetase/guanosine-3',5'-bis(diphosphate) 3'-pyrophosphohydrolase [Deltaproteobacteria bacterium]